MDRQQSRTLDLSDQEWNGGPGSDQKKQLTQEARREERLEVARVAQTLKI